MAAEFCFGSLAAASTARRLLDQAVPRDGGPLSYSLGVGEALRGFN
jgi:hypothetical protein